MRKVKVDKNRIQKIAAFLKQNGHISYAKALERSVLAEETYPVDDDEEEIDVDVVKDNDEEELESLLADDADLPDEVDDGDFDDADMDEDSDMDETEEIESEDDFPEEVPSEEPLTEEDEVNLIRSRKSLMRSYHLAKDKKLKVTLKNIIKSANAALLKGIEQKLASSLDNAIDSAKKLKRDRVTALLLKVRETM